MREMGLVMWQAHQQAKLVPRLAGMRWCINCKQEPQTAGYEAKVEAEVVEIRWSEVNPGDTASSMEALVEEVIELQKAMEQQSKLLLELVRQWQGAPGSELDDEPKEQRTYCDKIY